MPTIIDGLTEVLEWSDDIAGTPVWTDLDVVQLLFDDDSDEESAINEYTLADGVTAAGAYTKPYGFATRDLAAAGVASLRAAIETGTRIWLRRTKSGQTRIIGGARGMEGRVMDLAPLSPGGVDRTVFAFQGSRSRTERLVAAPIAV